MLYAFLIFDRTSNEVIFYHSYDGDAHLFTFTQLAMIGLEAVLQLHHEVAITYSSTRGQPQDQFFGHLLSTESLHVYGFMTNSQYKFIAITSAYLPPTAPIMSTTSSAGASSSTSNPPTTHSSPNATAAGQSNGTANGGNQSGTASPSFSTVSNVPNQVVLSPLVTPSYQVFAAPTTNSSNAKSGSYLLSSTETTTVAHPNGGLAVFIKGQPEQQQVQFIQTLFSDVSRLIVKTLMNPLSDLAGFAGDLTFPHAQIPLFQPQLVDAPSPHLFAINTYITQQQQQQQQPQPRSGSGMVNYTNINNLYGDRCLIQHNSPNLFSTSVRFQNLFIALFNSAQV